jgi:H+/Cl- antiporter ClcA
MNNKIVEETVLFVSIVKWVFMATVVGTMVGLSTAVFIKILVWSGRLAEACHYYFLLLPAAMVISVLLVTYLAPDAEGHGTEKVIEAIHTRSGRIKASVVPVKLAATIITLAAGGSVGKEGPCAQIGAGLTSLFADFLKVSDHDRKKLVICGISAGFASVFGTPISGAIFGVEVLFAGAILYDVLLPSFVAGVTAYQVAKALGVTYFYHPLELVPVFSETFFLEVIGAGVFFGLCSGFLIGSLRSGKRLASKIKLPKTVKALIGGMAVVALAFIFSKQYLGLGIPTLQATLEGTPLPWYAFIMKSIFTSITLNFGGSGGIVTPIFFIGAAAGSLFATLFALDLATFSAIGLVSLLAGAANTPISASIMAVELFGPKLAPYATVACIISYLMTGHRSVYPSQILAVSKSASIDVETGKAVDTADAHYKPREKGLIHTAAKVVRKIVQVFKGSTPKT